MINELIFRISIALIGATLLGIRIYYTIRWSKSPDATMADTDRTYTKFLAWSLGVLGDLSIAIYIFLPGWIEFAALPISIGLRWLGVVSGIICIPLLYWAHRSLGNEFDYPGVIKEQQTLVTSGPYHWVRHPIYTSYFIWTLAFLLISANWLIGLIWLAFSIAASSHVGLEEEALIEKFGDSYRDYIQQTGRFLPRLIYRQPNLH